jgi:hypothetical protein
MEVIDYILLVIFIMMTYLQMRHYKFRSFLKRILFAEFLRGREMLKNKELNIFNIQDVYQTSKRLDFFPTLLSLRPLTYKNYIFPDELDELRPYLQKAEQMESEGRSLSPDELDPDE